MSAYVTLLTPMTDQECLLAALTDLGFDSSKVEVHATPTTLFGYEGEQQSVIANVIIRRRHLNGANNDIGFLASSTGFQALIRGMDQTRFGSDWLAKLNAKYLSLAQIKQERMDAAERRRVEEAHRQLVEAQRSAIHERAKKMGYMVKETREGETLRLVLVRRTY